jgi:hypothetical protein
VFTGAAYDRAPMGAAPAKLISAAPNMAASNSWPVLPLIGFYLQ